MFDFEKRLENFKRAFDRRVIDPSEADTTMVQEARSIATSTPESTSDVQRERVGILGSFASEVLVLRPSEAQFAERAAQSRVDQASETQVNL